jgi:hypothetical protein
MYTHPLGGLMVVALAAGYLVLRAELRLSWRRWFWTQAIAALGILPWVRYYLDHPPEITSPLRLRLIFEWPEGSTGGRIEAVGGAVVLIGVGLWAARRGGQSDRDSQRPSQRRAALLLLAWFVLPTLLLLAYSLLAHGLFSQRRYLLFVAPAYLLLVARGMIALPRPALLAVLAFTTAMTVQVLPRRVYGGQCRPDWRMAAETIRRVAPGTRVLLLSPIGNKGPFQYYLGPQISVWLPDDQFRYLQRAPESLEQELWSVTPLMWGQPVMRQPQPLAEHYVTEQRFRFNELIISYHRLQSEARVVGARETSPQR